MQTITTIGLDIAKSVFQVHGVDAAGQGGYPPPVEASLRSANQDAEQQSGLVFHRTRHLYVRQQTSVINAIRAHLVEFGIVAPVGRKGVDELLHVVADPDDKRVPDSPWMSVGARRNCVGSRSRFWSLTV
jgi:transposase